MARTVRDVMSTQLITCPASTSLPQAARIMRDQNIGDVIVTDGDRLRGIVTDRDIVVRCVTEGGDISQTQLVNACSADLTFASPDMSIDEAAQLMGKKAVRRLPVVDNGRAVGIVSIGDLAVERDPNSTLGQISADAPNN
jgi:CBS domain-containing protein